MLKNKITVKRSIASCATILLMGGCGSDGSTSSGASSNNQATDQTINNPVAIIGSVPNTGSTAPRPTPQQPASPQPTAPAPAPPPTTKPS